GEQTFNGGKKHTLSVKKEVLSSKIIQIEMSSRNSQ
ncbi:unnamed protein product, partial [Heterotrigona itama]